MVASGGKHRPRCFFDIAVNGTNLGRVTFELFTDICPLTCENFRALCTGEKGTGKTTEKPLHYKGTPIHRVVKDFIIQGGDFSAGNGTGGESIYGGTFSDENFDFKHDRPFLLSMANRGKDTNGSQFFITTKVAPHLDGIHTVFGQLIMGSEVVQEVENQRVDNKSRPVADVRVTNCGELILKMKAKELKRKKKQALSEEKSSTDESSTESSESEDEKEKRKKKKKQKEKEKEQKKDQKEESVKEDKPPPVYQSELSSNVTIDPEQIPEIPTNRFLLRRSPLIENVNQRVHKMKQTRTRSGRKIKGRGPMRYRTPSRSRSRSVTPPHWRIEEQRGMGNPVPDQWKARGPGLRRASLGTIQDDRWEMGNALQPARPDNRRREPPIRRQSDSFPDQPRPRNRNIAIRSPRGPLSGRLGTRVGREEREPLRQREPLRRREIVEEAGKIEKGKEKEKKVEKEKKHKKEKDKSHKKHKKHKKLSDKDKHKDRSEETVKRKRAPSPNPPRSRSPKHDRGRVRSPKRSGGGAGDGRRRPSSPSPRDARRNASGGHTELKTNNRAAKSASLSPPPSRWKPGQKPWKPSDTNKHTGKKNDHTQPSVADQRNVADRSPSSSMDEHSPSPVTLRRHGPNRSPSPRHLSPQRDQSSPSRSPLPLTRRQDWPTSPSERVKLAVFPPSSPPQPPSHSEGSSSSGEDSESLKHPDSDAGGKTQKGDPYSSKNRKKYRKATKQRKRSPTLKERFQWQPPSEDENESAVVVGLVEARDPEKAGKFGHGPDGNDQEHKEKHRNSSDNNETDEDEAGLKDLEQKRTDLELRLAALTSHNRKIQEMVEGGGGASDDGADKVPSVDDPQVTKPAATSGFREADEPSLPLSNKGSELAPAVHSVSKDPSPKNQSAVREDSPSKIQRKRGHSRSKSRSRTPPKRRPRSKSRSRSRSRDRRSPPRHSQRKKSASPSRKRSARSRSKSPRRRSRSPEKVTRRSPKRPARKASRSPSGSRSPTPRRRSPVRKSHRSRSASSSRSPSPALRRKRQPVSPRRSKSRSRSRGRKDRDRRRSVSRDKHRSPPRRVSPRRPPPRRPSPRRRRRSRSPSPRRRRSRSISRTRRRSRSPLRRRRSAERSRSRSQTRRRRSPLRRDRSPRRRRRSNSRSPSSSGSSRSRSRSASRRRSRSYSRSSRYSSSSG